MTDIKCIALGDVQCGKTSVLITYSSNGRYPDEPIPSMYMSDCYNTRARLFEDQSVRVVVRDTSGRDDHDEIRRIDYDGVDVFLIVFSVADRTSFENVKEKWYPEIQKFSPIEGVPIILVGTKIDLRCETKDGEDSKFVSFEEGKKLSESLELIYVECSPKKNSESIEKLFQEVMKIGLKKIEKEKCSSSSKCIVM